MQASGRRGSMTWRYSEGTHPQLANPSRGGYANPSAKRPAPVKISLQSPSEVLHPSVRARVTTSGPSAQGGDSVGGRRHLRIGRQVRPRICPRSPHPYLAPAEPAVGPPMLVVFGLSNDCRRTRCRLSSLRTGFRQVSERGRRRLPACLAAQRVVPSRLATVLPRDVVF